jgi:glycosyltransferase involved in cell wall biosynthesis
MVVSCERNAGDYAIRCLESVYCQRYDRDLIKHLFIDDASDDGTHEKVLQWLDQHPDHRVEYLHREERLGGTSNTHYGFNRAEQDTVVIELNGDDWLSDDKVFDHLSRVYTDEDVWMTYNSLRMHNGPPVPWAKSFPPEVVEQNAFRDATDWPASHLHTFRKGLFDHLKEETFFDPQTGDYWECADDQAIYLGMLELAGWHSRHLNRITCVYNFWEESHSYSDNEKSVATAERIRKMARYQPLKGL